jgi:pheromone shutdown protein TraB
MRNTITLQGRILHLIGSDHSSTKCLSNLESIKPSLIFVEASESLLAHVRHFGEYSSAMDLPSIIAWADGQRIPLHPVDVRSSVTASIVFDGMGPISKIRLWSYVLMRKVSLPLCVPLFWHAIHGNSPPLIRNFVHRWCFSPTLVNEARVIITSGGSVQDVEDVIKQRQDACLSSFLSCVDYDPTAYLHVCLKTGIDHRLQSTLIDYRNSFMCHQIRRLLKFIPQKSVCAVVVGSNHVPGMLANLSSDLESVDNSFNDFPEAVSSPLDGILLANLLQM